MLHQIQYAVKQETNCLLLCIDDNKAHEQYYVKSHLALATATVLPNNGLGRQMHA